ncbi:MAG: tRNA pseudouridine(13) synthase TruD [Halobacteriota archaeon]
MRTAHPIERAVGMEYYVSDADGVGGVLRTEPEDFRVTELEAFDVEPIGAKPGAYPEVVLRANLRSWDTNDFARRLSNALSMSRERISWAGTKDKHAVTTQLFTVSKGDPDAIASLSIDGAEIEVLGRAGRALSFGDLYGNRFSIRVREADRPENVAAVTADLAAFAGGDETDTNGETTVGVPNYFGQQRFGSHRPVTHEVGLRIVSGDWREAVLAYVGRPADTEPEGTRAARAFVDEQAASADPDWQAALDRMPNRLRFERSMLHRLAEDGAETADDFKHALQAVPSNLQRLFVNAAQSYAFNRILSERLERGLPFDRPIAGDVCCFADRDAPEGVYAPDDSRLQRVTDRRVRTMQRHCTRGRAFVTAPLVGTETEFADGEQGEIERAVLEDLAIDPMDFSLPGNFDSTGTRRAILVRTDLAIDPDALRFDFSLPSGSYATVLLREYQKSGPIER